MLSVSSGQAAANALALWLSANLSHDITVYPRWPEPSNLPPKSISILRVGRTSRVDAFGLWLATRTNVGPTRAQVQFMFGAVEQPIQLDVWASTDVDRDDILGQLETVLYAGIKSTINVSGDPVRDGVLLPLADGFTGNVDFFFEDTTIDDTPEQIQRLEFRATIGALARFAITVDANVPRMLRTNLGLAIVDSLPPG
jgi:hypothetical protein